MRLVHRIRTWGRALDTRLRALQTDPPSDPYADALHIADQYRQRHDTDHPTLVRRPDGTLVAYDDASPDTRVCRRLEWWR